MENDETVPIVRGTRLSNLGDNAASKGSLILDLVVSDQCPDALGGIILLTLVEITATAEPRGNQLGG